MPKALLLWTAANINDTLTGNFIYAIGATDGTTEMSTSMGSVDIAAAGTSCRRMAPKIITLSRGDEVTIAEADRSSWSADNFVLNWTTNDAQPYVIHYLAIGGPQVAAKVVTWQAPTAVGARTVNGVPFVPEAVLHFHAGGAFTSNPPGTSGTGAIGMGMMDRSGGQCSFMISDAQAADPTVSGRAQRTNAAIYMFTEVTTPSVSKEASYVSMNGDGFTVNFTSANTNASQMFSLALGGIRAKVGNFNKTTAAAPASQAITSPGFRPGAVFLSSFQNVAQTAPFSEPHGRFGIGASDGTNEGSSAFDATDNVATTSVGSIDKTSKVFVKLNGPPLEAEADMASFDPTGFTLSWSTNDNVAAQMCFLALGAP
jgi:hypothetical protein